MGYHRMVLLVLLAGLLVSWSELLYASGLTLGLIPGYCFHPPRQGDCGGQASLRYFYDMKQDRCRQFVYKGCEGSLNNFWYLEDCISRCQIFAMVAKSHLPWSTLPIRCTFPKEKGHCKAAFRRYYYNTEKKKCEEFIFGGCGENPNNFETIEDCTEECERFGEGIVG